MTTAVLSLWLTSMEMAYIYFVNQVGGNELWRNLGGGKFKNITREAGVGLPDRISVGAAFADIENDGHIFLSPLFEDGVSYSETMDGNFTDFTREAGPP